MKSVVVVGAQWGDEGKGKVVDYLAGSFDYIARCAGGHNAGHTVIFNGDRFVLQLIPCGILRPARHAVIGAGVVVDPEALVNEIQMLAKAGIDVSGRLHVSNRAHLIFPYHRERIRAYITDTSALLNSAMDGGHSVLFEGAQGTMLDIDHGTYPYVTSSNATSGGAATGLGVPPTKISAVLNVSKAYTTRVGSGPFPTEMPDLEAKEVRERGKEFGAVTGRPRRCGWLDLMVLRYAKMINGMDSLVITKLDVFDTQREIQVCTGYRYKGSPIHEMPASAEELESVTPEYKSLPGWCQSTYGVRDAAQLPKAALNYLRFISDSLDAEIGMISTGPERDATIIPAGTLFASWL